MLDSYIPLIIF